MNKVLSVTVLLSILIMGSCSTMSFLPREGGAAKFNLATVEYVKAQNDAQQAELSHNLSANIESILDSMLMDDRAALAAFESQLDSLNSALTAFATKIDSSEIVTEKMLTTMSKELTTVKTNASSTRMVIRRINDNIDTLPVKALETFNKAIKSMLLKLISLEYKLYLCSPWYFKIPR